MAVGASAAGIEEMHLGVSRDEQDMMRPWVVWVWRWLDDDCGQKRTVIVQKVLTVLVWGVCLFVFF